MADLSRDTERMRKNRRIGLSVAAAIFLIDQAVKWVVTYPLQLKQRHEIDVVPFFTLRWLENRGVSMGLLNAQSETIEVTKSDYLKCGRCWRLLPEVEEDGGLCARCEGVLNG